MLRLYLIRETEKKIDEIENLEIIHGRNNSSKKIIDSLKQFIDDMKNGTITREMTMNELAREIVNKDMKMTKQEYNSLVKFF